MKKELQQPMRGIIPPLVTPLRQNGELDAEALQRLIEHLIKGGVHGLFILGTTGEGPSLSAELRRLVISHTCQIVDGRIPIYVGITDTSLNESVSLAQHAANCGASAVVAAPPYYFTPSQNELEAYFKQLNSKLSLPLVLYNMPALTHCIIEPKTVGALFQEESIVGLKDSSGDLDYFKQVAKIVASRPEFSLMVGPEHLVAETMALGGQGGVTGGANVWPQPFVELYNAALEDNQPAVLESQANIKALGEIYNVGPFSIPGIIARTKAATSLLGLCGKQTAAPIAPSTKEELAKIDSIIQQLGINSSVSELKDSVQIG